LSEFTAIAQNRDRASLAMQQQPPDGQLPQAWAQDRTKLRDGGGTRPECL